MAIFTVPRRTKPDSGANNSRCKAWYEYADIYKRPKKWIMSGFVALASCEHQPAHIGVGPQHQRVPPPHHLPPTPPIDAPKTLRQCHAAFRESCKLLFACRWPFLITPAGVAGVWLTEDTPGGLDHPEQHGTRSCGVVRFAVV